MADMQSEILFIAKFGGIVLAACTHYIYVIKPIAIFNERQKIIYKLLKEIESKQDELDHDFTILKTEHEINNCKKISKKNIR